MTLKPLAEQIPGNPEIFGLAVLSGTFLCATSDGLFSKADGEWERIEPNDTPATVFVEVDYFGSVKALEGKK